MRYFARHTGRLDGIRLNSVADRVSGFAGQVLFHPLSACESDQGLSEAASDSRPEAGPTPEDERGTIAPASNGGPQPRPDQRGSYEARSELDLMTEHELAAHLKICRRQFSLPGGGGGGGD